MSALTLVCLSGHGPAGSPFGLMLISIPWVADAGVRLTSAVRLVTKRQAAQAAAREIVFLNFRCMDPPSTEMPQRKESFQRTQLTKAKEAGAGWRPRHRSWADPRPRRRRRQRSPAPC